MEIKQYCLLLFTTVLAILLVDAKSGTQNESEARRCHSTTCTYLDTNNTVKCGHPENWISCPDHLQSCVTVATSPNFTSILTCGPATNSSCSLQHSSTQSLDIIQLTCTCSENFCNQPLSVLLRNQLINFTKSNLTENKIESFLSSLPKNMFANQQEALGNENYTKFNDDKVDVPRAEALKHEVTAPSDDDEDESEGSGSYDETRTHSVPAAPSSYLPAEKSKGVRHHLNVLLAILFFNRLV